MRMTSGTVLWTSAGLLGVAAASVAAVLLTAQPSKCEPGMHGHADAEPTAARNPTAAASGSAMRVKTVRPTVEPFKRETVQPAHVEPFEKTDIYAKASGYLKHVYVDIGDVVENEKILAELWIPEMQKELELKKALEAQASAEVHRQVADEKFRKTELDRAERFFRQNNLQEDVVDEKRHQYEAAQAATAAANAKVLVAQREREYLEEMIKYAVIKAPYPGIITRRLMDTGAFVQSAADNKKAPLFTIQRHDRLRIITDVPESDAHYIKKGLPASLSVDVLKGKPFTGTVERFADALDPSTRTMQTEIKLDDESMARAKATGLRLGMFGTITITLADHPKAVMIPANALLSSEGENTVMAVESGRVREKVVRVGFNDGVHAHITKGLTGTEDLVTDSKHLVEDGQAVEIAK